MVVEKEFLQLLTYCILIFTNELGTNPIVDPMDVELLCEAVFSWKKIFDFGGVKKQEKLLTSNPAKY